ncbi:MAG TPA: hypothetical protein VK886_13370 [Vicinamibacterales bacterium]|nr:hypothetical protein [Vicinamibacterales bacterium]
MRDYYDLIGVRRNAGADEVRRACRRLSAPEPWDDDVAIEFPSASRVVDRIRASFFGEPPAGPPALAAEIAISSEEARTGADVPLMLPARTLCPACGGRGEVWLDTCARCSGAGELVSPRQIRVTLPAGVEDGAVLRFALPASAGSTTTIEIRVAVQ